MGCAVVKRHVSIDTNFPKIHSRMQQAKYYNKLDNKLRVLNSKIPLTWLNLSLDMNNQQN